VLLLAVSPLLAQEFQIRATLDLVVVPFSVKGDGNALNAGLGADDLTVFEDGVEQTIERFSINPIPLSAAVVIDTGVAPDSLDAIQAAIPAIVFGFSAFDEVALFRYDNTVVQMQGFTEDRDVLRAALDELKDYLPVTQFYPRAPVQPGPVINGIPSIMTASIPATADKRVLHDAVWEAGLALRDRPDDRRKIIVLVADGNDTRSNRSLEQTRLFLIEHEIQIYPVVLDNIFLPGLPARSAAHSMTTRN
jgi:VWFA-related protein